MIHAENPRSADQMIRGGPYALTLKPSDAMPASCFALETQQVAGLHQRLRLKASAPMSAPNLYARFGPTPRHERKLPFFVRGVLAPDRQKSTPMETLGSH